MGSSCSCTDDGQGLSMVSDADLVVLIELAKVKTVDKEAARALVDIKEVTFPTIPPHVVDGFWTVLENLPNLRQLNFPYVQQTEKDLHRMSKMCITSLDLGMNPRISDSTFRVLRQVTTLESLFLGMTPITDCMLEILSSIPFLQHLDISSSKKLTYHASNILADFPSLLTLDLSYCPWLDAEGLKKILEKDQLEALQLAGCRGLSPSVGEVISKSSKLRLLSLDRCGYLGPACLLDIFQGEGQLQTVSTHGFRFPLIFEEDACKMGWTPGPKEQEWIRSIKTPAKPTGPRGYLTSYSSQALHNLFGFQSNSLANSSRSTPSSHSMRYMEGNLNACPEQGRQWHKHRPSALALPQKPADPTGTPLAPKTPKSSYQWSPQTPSTRNTVCNDLKSSSPMIRTVKPVTPYTPNSGETKPNTPNRGKLCSLGMPAQSLGQALGAQLSFPKPLSQLNFGTPRSGDKFALAKTPTDLSGRKFSQVLSASPRTCGDSEPDFKEHSHPIRNGSSHQQMYRPGVSQSRASLLSESGANVYTNCSSTSGEGSDLINSRTDSKSTKSSSKSKYAAGPQRASFCASSSVDNLKSPRSPRITDQDLLVDLISRSFFAKANTDTG